MPRYVILEHDHPALHWDLLLEAGSGLRAWRLPSPPTAGETLTAQANFDHRPFYLDYEGPVSGNRGTVTRWDAGTFNGTLDGEHIDIGVAGQKLSGRLILDRQGDQTWQLRFQPALRESAASPPSGSSSISAAARDTTTSSAD